MIHVAFYEDGRKHPILMLRGESPGDLSALREVFSRLADGAIDNADIMQLAQVRGEGIDSIRLSVGPDDLSPFRKSRVAFDPARPTSFAWAEARDVWQDCVCMLEPLTNPDSAGHQYLVVGDRYDLTILVERSSSNERRQHAEPTALSPSSGPTALSPTSGAHGVGGKYRRR